MAFIQNVLIPKVYVGAPSASNLGATSDLENLTYHFINEHNYFCGMRMTLKRVAPVVNDDPLTKDAFPFYRPETYSSADQEYSTEMNEPLGNKTKFYYSKKYSYRGKGGYVAFFNGTLPLYSAIGMFESMKQAGWFAPDPFLSLAVELIYYNANYLTGLYLSLTFVGEEIGTLKKDSYSMGFYPQNYDSHLPNSLLSMFYALQVLYQIFFFLFLLNVIVIFIYHAIDFFSGKKTMISVADWLSVVLIAFCLTSLGLWWTHVMG